MAAPTRIEHKKQVAEQRCQTFGGAPLWSSARQGVSRKDHLLIQIERILLAEID